MSRRPRAHPQSAKQAASGANDDRGSAPGEGTFAGLRQQLRANQSAMQAPEPARPVDKKIRPSAQRATAPPKVEADDHTVELQPAELALFRKTVGATTPLRGDSRAEIERPRPAPVPRQRKPDDEDKIDAAAPTDGHDSLSLAYDGVLPLRASGRVELETPLRHGARIAGPGGVPRVQRPDAIVLPADADLGDSAALFRAVVGDARPVDSRNRVEIDRPAPPPAPIKREEDERAALTESLLAPLSFEDRLDMGDEAAFLRPGLPRRVLTDLRRGRWVLQGQIDLHGLVRDEARSALAHFLHDSLVQGKRCIRVIHGKGHGSPGKVPILKQLSRGWLAQREEILAFCQAGPHHGGGGALLVLLRAQNAAPR